MTTATTGVAAAVADPAASTPSASTAFGSTASASTASTPSASATGLLALGYRRLVATCEDLDARIARPGSAEWADALAPADGPAELDAFIGAEAARIREATGHEPRGDAAASRALNRHLWGVSLLMSGIWYLERRVPRIKPREIRCDRTTNSLRVLPGSAFACLPDDPAAGLRGARVVADEEALRAELRAAVADHARPLLAAIGPHTRRGPRASWGMAADCLISGIWYLGRTLGQEERAVQAATELLPEAIPPFPGGAGFRLLAGREGTQHRTRTRLGCCMYYTLPEARACQACPRTCDTERLRRLEEED
ncbi:(2Fe-2S)-binding protein [Streptomyces sp. NPDC089799]|uniref:(2Fe-2S)-binding protein n=1 Tax=Streptomyces sp. NPDC089799 TaxID=3155066 RepID=UPI00344AC486